jgi:hypothetical protein
MQVTACKWGLKKLGKADLTQYTFPDLSEIAQQLGTYVSQLNTKPPRPSGAAAAPAAVAWPALSLRLKVGQQITEPGMVLMLGNPVDSGNSIQSDVMNGLLPGVSYQTIHQQWIAPPGFGGKFCSRTTPGQRSSSRRPEPLPLCQPMLHGLVRRRRLS